jgi:hypothetical protein
MSRFKNVIVALGILFVATTANASFLIEPHLGYNVSGGQSDFDGSKMEYTGAQYGARLGMQFLGVMGGFDYTRYTSSTTMSANGASGTIKSKEEDMGIFVGYNAPILLRAWLGYYFSAKSTVTGYTNISGMAVDDYFKGSATELGLGFTPLPLVSINLVYRMLNYDKDQDGTANPVYKPKEIVLGVSLPFHLL